MILKITITAFLLLIGFSKSENYEVPNAILIDHPCMSFEGDFKLDDCNTGELPNYCCSYWTRSITPNVHMILGLYPYISYDGSCTTGGENQCFLGECDTEVDEAETEITES